MKRIGIVVFAAWLLAALAHAQDSPKVDFSVQYSPLYVLKGYTIWMNGASVSAGFHANNWLALVGDFGVYVGHVPETITGETYTFGPRFLYHRSDRFVPFAQALFGGSHFSESTGGITGGGSQFAFDVGGGADFLGPRGRFAVRPQFEYVGIRSNGSITPAVRLGIGIVYRVGVR